MSWEAFEEHHLRAVRFGRAELEALGRVMAGQDPGLEGAALREFQAKLDRIPKPAE